MANKAPNPNAQGWFFPLVLVAWDFVGHWVLAISSSLASLFSERRAGKKQEQTQWPFAHAVLLVSLLSPKVFADWSEPKDGVFTEQQLTAYLDTSKEWIATMKAAGKPVEGSPSGFTALVLYARGSQQFHDSLAKHGLEEAEFNWLGSKTWEAWSAIDADQMAAQADADMASESRKNVDHLADDQARLAAYQKALAEGRKVMSADERDAAIKQAQNEQQSSTEEAAQHAEEARSAAADAAKSDAESKADDALATAPPSSISDDEKGAFIDGKKNDAQAARDSAQEDRMKAADAKQAQADAEAKAAVAAATARQPDVPQTEEEKADFKKQNQQMIAQLQADISAAQDATKQLAETGDATRKALMQQRAKIPQANVDLLKKHLHDFADVWQIKTSAETK